MPIESQVHPTNAEQLKAWDGDQGDFWTRRADRFDAGVARYHEHLLAALAIEPNWTVLDVGCGAGRLTIDAARQAHPGSVLGLDLSASLLRLAAQRAEAEGVDGAVFDQLDVQNHPLTPGGFDLVTSRHGTLFFGDPDLAFANLCQALRPGRRMVQLSWQPAARNEWMRTFRTLFSGQPLPEVQPRPGALTDPDLTRELLTGAGFTDVELTPLHEPMWFGADVADAYDFLTEQFGWLLRDKDPGTQSKILAAVREDIGDHLTGDGIRYDSAAWLIEARRP